jgi:pimeloyl-ACP methyl ester carboxylesterase
VVLHGFNFAGFYFGGLIDALRKEGFRVIVPDQIGFGRSSKPIIPHNFHDMARNTFAILQNPKIAGRVVLMGGMLAARFASQYPDVERGDTTRSAVDSRFDRRIDSVDAVPATSRRPIVRVDALRRTQPGGMDARELRPCPARDAQRRLAAAGDGRRWPSRC